MRTSLCLALVLSLTGPVLVGGCADTGTGLEPEAEPESPPDIRPDPPAVPDANDDAFTVTGLPAWSLVGNDLTPAPRGFTLTVEGDASFVDAWIDGTGARLLPADDGTFTLAYEGLDGLAPGEIEVLLAADGADTAFFRGTITRTHPLYVVLGTDWDDPDNMANTYTLQEELHDLHPELRITHFVGPYTWTDTAVSPDRVEVNEMWLHSMVDGYADEIAVHIHPYCNFVDTTHVPCRIEPSVVYASDTTGYTVESAAYTEEEYTALLLAADELFMAAGFDKPVSFRAGAWTADMSTLLAVKNAGYTVDSNAYNWARMEEWIGLGNGGFYNWVSTHWSEMGDLSQPYYPSEADIQAAGEPAVPVLEVPLNGVMADYVTGEEMIEIFDANWPGGALSAPLTYAIGYHPPNFGTDYQERILTALDHVGQHLFSDDEGPVVYATFQELTLVYPR